MHNRPQIVSDVLCSGHAVAQSLEVVSYTCAHGMPLALQCHVYILLLVYNIIKVHVSENVSIIKKAIHPPVLKQSYYIHNFWVYIRPSDL